MWLRTPDTIAQPLWEGPLEADNREAVDRLDRELSVRKATADVSRALQELPVVSIGRPEVWRLQEVYPVDQMPGEMRAKLEEADFYLVRLACSFRPRRRENRIEWARFVVQLRPDPASYKAIAFDLHPLQVTREAKRNVKVSLSPTLKFQEVEASLGEVAFGLEYPELQPLISAAGAGESQPSWDYESVKGVRVQGSKWMHLLVKAPKEMRTGLASLDLVADVQIYNARLPVQIPKGREEETDHLGVQLW